MSVKEGDPSATKRVRVTDLDTHYVSLVRQIMALPPSDGNQLPLAIGVISSLPSEGTSTVATNIALTAAGLDTGPVLLVDANDAKPSLHRTFGIKMRVGLQNALGGKHSPLECVTSSRIEQLSLVLNGRPRVNETAMYSSSSINEMMSEWQDAFRLIVVDLPAVSYGANGTLLAGRMDGVLLVIQDDRVNRTVVARTAAQLRHGGVNLVGAVYNKLTKGKVSW